MCGAGSSGLGGDGGHATAGRAPRGPGRAERGEVTRAGYSGPASSDVGRSAYSSARGRGAQAGAGRRVRAPAGRRSAVEAGVLTFWSGTPRRVRPGFGCISLRPSTARPSREAGSGTKDCVSLRELEEEASPLDQPEATSSRCSLWAACCCNRTLNLLATCSTSYTQLCLRSLENAHLAAFK